MTAMTPLEAPVLELLQALGLPHLPPQVVQPPLELGHRARPRLAVLHRLGEEEREGGEADLLLALAEAPVEDGGLGPEAGRHEGAGGHVGPGASCLQGPGLREGQGPWRDERRRRPPGRATAGQGGEVAGSLGLFLGTVLSNNQGVNRDA